MGDPNSESVEIPEELIDTLERRATRSRFESTDEYVEYILRSVVQELDPVDNVSDEDQIEQRLKSLGYLEK